jgi:hypothetical protein
MTSNVEQDNVAFTGPNELPSYDDLAAHNGPNSRQVSGIQFRSLMTYGESTDLVDGEAG